MMLLGIAQLCTVAPASAFAAARAIPPKPLNLPVGRLAGNGLEVTPPLTLALGKGDLAASRGTASRSTKSPTSLALGMASKKGLLAGGGDVVTHETARMFAEALSGVFSNAQQAQADANFQPVTTSYRCVEETVCLSVCMYVCISVRLFARHYFMYGV